jgi:hypothetical protein
LNFRESRAGLSPEPVEPSTRGAREPLVPVPRHQPTYLQGIGEPELQIGGVGDVYIAEQLGHTDPRFTLTVYTKAVKRRGKLSGAYLAEYERSLAWAALPTAEKARMGTSAQVEGAIPLGDSFETA